MDRKDFIRTAAASSLIFPFGPHFARSAPPGDTAGEDRVMTVTGPIPAGAMGFTLVHEHILSRFGPPPEDPPTYDRKDVIQQVVPYLNYIRSTGCETIVDCTARYFGRDPGLLAEISRQTGLRILTNTGIYGAADDRYIPEYAYGESALQLAERWVKEFEEGIGDTEIRPGFVKIGVDGGGLSEIDAKLVRAAAITHRRTGLLLQIHTSDNLEAAERQLTILEAEKVHPSAWSWVHAHNVDDSQTLIRFARRGAWISLDGLRTPNYLNGYGDSSSTLSTHLEHLEAFRAAGMLDRVILSHDGSTYPPEGVAKRPMDVMANTFIPMLKAAGFTDREIRTVTVDNPAKAFTIKQRTL